MWKLIKPPVTQLATKTLAKEFATMDPCPNDRPIRKAIMEAISAELDAGTFRGCEWASCECEETQNLYRVNGKHTSTILHEKNGSIKEWPYVTVARYHAETLADVADLYRTFDSKVSARNQNDINVAYAAAHPSLKDLPVRTLGLATSAIAFAEHEFMYTSKTAPHERAESLLNNVDFVIWLNEIVEPKDGHPFKKIGIGAAMFKTWTKSHAAATEFWTEVRDGTNPSPKSVTRKLQKLLLTCGSFHGVGIKSAKPKMDFREWMCKSLHAWNAWRTNTDSELKYFPKAATPAAK